MQIFAWPTAFLQKKSRKLGSCGLKVCDFFR
jgi:hypothetical protein